MITNNTGKSELLDKLTYLLHLYKSGKLGGTSHEVYPNLEKGSTENYLYFTLASSINFQRKSEGLWQSALSTYQDPETSFVFNPTQVMSVSEDAVRRALIKHNLALLPEKHTYIWATLCNTFYKYYCGTPKKLLEDCSYDVVKVIKLLQSKKKWFPYLSGPKLSNYWLYILSHFTDVKLKSKEEISIIPDLHVIRATYHLGLVSSETVKPEHVAQVWKEFLSGTELAPSDLHAPLWRWSRRGFKPEL